MKGLGLRSPFRPVRVCPLVAALVIGSLLLSIKRDPASWKTTCASAPQTTAAGVIQLLQMSDSLIGETNPLGDEIIQEKAPSEGPASAGGAVAVGSRRPLGLRFGGRAQTLDTALVDSVTAHCRRQRRAVCPRRPGFCPHRHQCQNCRRWRAVGTVLDPQSQAYAMLSKGQPFMAGWIFWARPI